MAILNVFFFLIMSAVHADVMNLNDLMPTRLEDASPIEEKSFDSQSTAMFSKMKSQDEMTFRQNFRYGLSQKIQLESYGDFISGGDETGSGEMLVGGLYEINEENDSHPVFAISPMIVLPTGKYNHAVESDLKFIVTSTLKGSVRHPETQIHFNLNWRHNPSHRDIERQNSYFSILGISTMISDKAALVIDFYREEEREKGEEVNIVEAGIHQEIGSDYFIGLNSGKGLGDDSPDWQGLVSFEKQFP